jgi:hypothetical protein
MASEATPEGASPQGLRKRHATGPLPTLPRKRGRASVTVLAMRLRIRVLLHALRKPVQILPRMIPKSAVAVFGSDHAQKKGGGAPIDASEPESAADHLRDLRKRPAARRAPSSCFPPPLAGEDQGGGHARLSALHRGTTPRPYSTRLRAALPGTTGSKRENPPRHQCSEHLAVRSRAGRDDARSRPDEGHKPHPGTAPAPSIGCHRSTSLR